MANLKNKGSKGERVGENKTGKRVRAVLQIGKLITVNIGLLLIFYSCSDSSSVSVDSDFPDIPGFDVQLGEDTRVMPDHLVDAALTGSDEENYTFTFDSEILADADFTLETGEILLLEYKALRRITRVTESNGSVTVETEFAALNEAFENADVNWTETIDFSKTQPENAMLEYKGKLYPSNMTTAAGQAGWEYKFGPFNVEGALEASEESAVISLLVKYSESGLSGAMKAVSRIRKFDNVTEFEIRDHKTESFGVRNNNIAGDLDLEFIFAGGISSEQSWEPPMPAVIIPFTIGPIPVQFRMGVVFITKFDLGINGTALFESKFSYDGISGVQIVDTDFTPIAEGGINKPNADAATSNAAGFGGSVEGQFGVALPKIQLNIFGEAVVPYISLEFYARAKYTFPECTQHGSRYQAKAGVDMKMFGLVDLSFDETLASEDLHSFDSEGCGSSKIVALNRLPSINIDNPAVTSGNKVPFRIE